MTKKIFAAALVTGMLGVILYLFFPKDLKEATTTNLADVPDIYLNGVQIRTFNAKGKLAYELHAEEIEQFSSEHTMLFKHLMIQVERDSGERWHIHAQQGSIQPDRDQPSQILEPIRLLGAVKVYSGDVENSEYSFHGANVIYDPRANTVHSNEPVSIKADTSNYEADAFHFDLTTKQLELSSEPDNQVEIQYETGETE